MGLEVTAYSQIEKIHAVLDEDGFPLDPETGEEIQDAVYLQVNPGFREVASDIENGAIYRFKDVTWLEAVPYSRYNQWREQLAELAGFKTGVLAHSHQITSGHAVGAWQAESGPFREFIDFSDAEGILGPAVCKKLAEDFIYLQNKADAHSDELFRKTYADWRSIFELAANNGVVVFH